MSLIELDLSGPRNPVHFQWQPGFQQDPLSDIAITRSSQGIAAQVV